MLRQNFVTKLIEQVDPSWSKILYEAFCCVDENYLKFLATNQEYFPNKKNFLNAFKLPLVDTKYILLGQDPYPRVQSASGYSFIDSNVGHIFSDIGLSKEVNRATSLRNFIKMIIVCNGHLNDNTTQYAIASLKKDNFISRLDELKDNLLNSGFLLLNMALVFTKKEDSLYHIKMFKPFIDTLLNALKTQELILFGNIAKRVKATHLKSHRFCHPFNTEFIQDKNVQKLFQQFNLIGKR